MITSDVGSGELPKHPMFVFFPLHIQMSMENWRIILTTNLGEEEGESQRVLNYQTQEPWASTFIQCHQEKSSCQKPKGNGEKYYFWRESNSRYTVVTH